MNAQKLTIYLIVALFFLVLSGSFMTAFQNWVQQSAQSSKSTPKYPTTMGLRSVVSTTPKAIVVEKTPPVSAHYSEPAIESAAPTYDLPSSITPIELNAYIAEKIADKPLPVVALNPLIIKYDDAIVLQIPKSLASANNLKRAIAKVVLSANPLVIQDLLANEAFDVASKPFLYGQVLNQARQPIRYPKQAYEYADALLRETADGVLNKAVDADYVSVTIALTEPATPKLGLALQYQKMVDNYSAKFNVDPSLVYAVMEVESQFNPKAVSKSNAIGLMQIKSAAAGKDVLKHFDLIDEQPTVEALFNPDNNVRIGTAYLSLLKHDYFSAVESEKTREILTVSSYNGGLSTVLALFGDSTEKAINRINRMSPNAVYKIIQTHHKSDETRNYLDKVMNTQQKYRDILG